MYVFDKHSTIADANYGPLGLNKEIAIVIIIGVLGLFIGAAEFAVLSEVIYSGVASTFVCLAEDPAALRRTKPELFDKIAQVGGLRVFFSYLNRCTLKS